MLEPNALSTGFADLEAGPTLRVRIWDLPTRLFHWTLALAVLGQFLTAWAGWMEWHMRSGYLVLALLLFRLVWGFVGGHWSRFHTFLYGPGALLRYLRGRGAQEHEVGHTPLGALSVFAMFALLALQVASGLMADDEISAAGPLTRFVSGDTVGLASAWHAFAKWAVLALVVLHVAAVLYYKLVRRQRLVGAMLSGDKLLTHGARSSRDDLGARLMALILFAACLGVAAWVASLRT